MTSYTQLCKEYEIPYKLFSSRYYDRGWELLEALETPKMSNKDSIAKATKESANRRRFIGSEKENLYKTLDNAYYLRVRRAVAKGIRWKDALRLCKKPFGAKDYGEAYE